MISMIKFRAWDKEEQKYLYEIQDAFDMMSGHVKDSNGNDVLYDAQSFGDFLEDDARYIVEQYTGMKDVNGKDIYVGDIVQPIHVIKDSLYVDGWVVTNEKPIVVADDSYVFSKWIARSVADNGFGVSDWHMEDELTIVGDIHLRNNLKPLEEE